MTLSRRLPDSRPADMRLSPTTKQLDGYCVVENGETSLKKSGTGRVSYVRTCAIDYNLVFMYI